MASAVVVGLYLASLHSYLLSHSLAEFFSIFVACGVFMVFWNSRRFLENGKVDRLFPQMRTALSTGDLVEVGRLGHRMKGTVVYLGAHPAEEAALSVERFCQSSGGTSSEAEKAIHTLEHECIALKAALVGHPLAADPARRDEGAPPTDRPPQIA